jgi:hypothetical protein
MLMRGREAVGRARIIDFLCAHDKPGRLFLRSSVKSVSENALMLSYAFFRPDCMLQSQN